MRWVLRGTLLRAAGATSGSSLSTLAGAAAPAVAGAHTQAEEPLPPAFESSNQDDQEFHEARARYRAWRAGSTIASPPRTPDPMDEKARRHHGPFAWSLLPPARLPLPPPAPPPRLVTDFDDFSLVGRGGFGVVYSARNRLDGHKFAIKLVPDRTDAHSEAKCMAALPPHANLIRYHSAWREQLPLARLQEELAELDADASFRRPPWHANHELASIDSMDMDGDDDDDDEASASGASVGSPVGTSAMVRLPTLCLQLELCQMPTLSAVLAHEMAQRCSTTSSPRSSSVISPPRASSVSPPLRACASSRPPPPRLSLPAAATVATPLAGVALEPCTDAPYAAAPYAAAHYAAAPYAAAPYAAAPTSSVRWQWVAGVASALEAMHACGWLHNDVKPANVFCAPDGAVKLGDFGLAAPLTPSQPPAVAAPAMAAPAAATQACTRAAATAPATPLTAPTRTRSGAGTVTDLAPETAPPAGTPTYMSPERHTTQPHTHAEVPGPPADVYALGVCVAEIHGGFATAMERAAVVHRLKLRAACGDEALHEGTTPWEGLALDMLKPQPEARPSVQQVQHTAKVLAALPRAGGS